MVFNFPPALETMRINDLREAVLAVTINIKVGVGLNSLLHYQRCVLHLAKATIVSYDN